MQYASRRSPSFWSFICSLPQSVSSVRASSGAEAPAHGEERLRRELVREVILRRPEAFSSELDVQAMMYMYPGRF